MGQINPSPIQFAILTCLMAHSFGCGRSNSGSPQDPVGAPSPIPSVQAPASRSEYPSQCGDPTIESGRSSITSTEVRTQGWKLEKLIYFGKSQRTTFLTHIELPPVLGESRQAVNPVVDCLTTSISNLPTISTRFNTPYRISKTSGLVSSFFGIQFDTDQNRNVSVSRYDAPGARSQDQRQLFSAFFGSYSGHQIQYQSTREGKLWVSDSIVSGSSTDRWISIYKPSDEQDASRTRSGRPSNRSRNARARGTQNPTTGPTPAPTSSIPSAPEDSNGAADDEIETENGHSQSRS